MLIFFHIIGVMLKEVSLSETIIEITLDCKTKISIFHHSKNYGSLTPVTMQIKSCRSKMSYLGHLVSLGLPSYLPCTRPI